MQHSSPQKASRSQGDHPARRGRWLLLSFLLVVAALSAESANTGSEQACVNACAPDGTCTCIAPPRAAAPKLAIDSCVDAGCEGGRSGGFEGEFATSLLQGRRVRQEDVVQVAAVRRNGRQGGGGAGGAGDVVDAEKAFLFAVYDGHAGARVAETAGARLHTLVEARLLASRPSRGGPIISGGGPVQETRGGPLLESHGGPVLESGGGPVPPAQAEMEAALAGAIAELDAGFVTEGVTSGSTAVIAALYKLANPAHRSMQGGGAGGGRQAGSSDGPASGPSSQDGPASGQDGSASGQEARDGPASGQSERDEPASGQSSQEGPASRHDGPASGQDVPASGQSSQDGPASGPGSGSGAGWGWVLTLANVGDSRAVLVRVPPDGPPQAETLTRAHKPSLPEERARVEALPGGFVRETRGALRVQGELAVTRALGDTQLKPFVSAVPDVTTARVQEHDEVLVLCSDGLTDVMDEQDILSLVLARLYPPPVQTPKP
ncbi:phosphatase 2C-domain-containing protein [Baffinella frigidus]|nr:phosphatase 2C-domain-containing protein [Cryptophyta sp. CCMP2293]